ncbi:2-hydroxyisoflavanone synthase [Symbiodinium microadriaticum]|uniref:2-hydroxyisoflavanone synthase n=1 Tax=Symbiodinium microadriaticum TaxID=2951 RepID=A0A1Q9EZH3_SYMMI|nr:2-hydroxyisoflavanone synthase [Symbiodinium microadriaticum]
MIANLVINWNLLYLAMNPEKQDILRKELREVLGVINWNLLYLAMNPEKQDILRKELREVLGSGDLTDEIAANMKSKLPYLRAVIRETHRVAPPSSIMTQRAAPCDLELAGYKVPEGTQVGFNVFSLQNDPKYVEEMRPCQTRFPATRAWSVTGASAYQKAKLPGGTCSLC